MSQALLVAAGLYGLNLLVGLLAQTGRFHFGRAHHGLYLMVFVAAGLAMLLRPHPGLILTLVALGLMPRMQPGGWRHPLVALAGAGGYLLAIGP